MTEKTNENNQPNQAASVEFVEKTLCVKLTPQQWSLIQQLCFYMQGDDEMRPTTHGPLIIPKLVTMLLEDCALAVRRPGSWEGANMLQLLAGHGYRI